MVVGYIVEHGEVEFGKAGGMTHYKYLIVGGGMTADAAVNGICEADPRRIHRPDQRGTECTFQPPASFQRPLEG